MLRASYLLEMLRFVEMTLLMEVPCLGNSTSYTRNTAKCHTSKNEVGNEQYYILHFCSYKSNYIQTFILHYLEE